MAAGEEAARACHHLRHHRCALCLSHAAVRYAASVATAARAGAAGGTASPRQVRSPPRRSCLLAALLVLWHSRAACAWCVFSVRKLRWLWRGRQRQSGRSAVAWRCVALRRAGRSAGGWPCPRAMHVRVVVDWGVCCVLCCCATRRGGCYLGSAAGAAVQCPQRRWRRRALASRPRGRHLGRCAGSCLVAWRAWHRRQARAV